MDPEARKRQTMIWYSIAAVIGVLVFQYFWSSYTQIETLDGIAQRAHTPRNDGNFLNGIDAGET